MQLILLLLLLAMGGNSQNILREVKPVLENLGGEQMQQAIKSAEQIEQVLSAVRTATQNIKTDTKKTDEFPLAPISSIADRQITYSLNKFIQSE